MTLKHKIASILAGLVIGGCGGTQIVPVQQPIEKPVASTHSTYGHNDEISRYEKMLDTEITTTKNTAEVKKNKNSHLMDVDRRIAKFHPVIQDEYKQGKFKVDFKETNEKRLNAFYDPQTDKITVECTPRFERCNTSAMEHEVAHYIDQHLTEEEQKKVYSAIGKRIAQSDMDKFRDEVEKLNDIREKMADIFKDSGNVSACNSLLNQIDYGENFKLYSDKILKSAKITKTDSTAYQNSIRNLETAIEFASKSWESCNEENAKKTHKAQNKTLKSLATLSEQIYHNGEKVDINDPKYQSFLERIDDAKAKELIRLVKSAIEEHNEEYKKLISATYSHYWKILNTRNPMTPERTDRLKSTLKEEWEEEHFDLNNLMYGANKTSDHLINSSRDFKESQLRHQPTHDAEMPEQFAAGIDSLLARYRGAVKTGPMHFSLDKPTLEALADVTYKGHKIFQEAVRRY